MCEWITKWSWKRNLQLEWTWKSSSESAHKKINGQIKHVKEKNEKATIPRRRARAGDEEGESGGGERNLGDRGRGEMARHWCASKRQ